LINKNPAARLGRFTKSDKPEFRAIPITREKCELFLNAALEVCPEYHVLFLSALRAGLRRGELVALR
jgi:integrase